MYCPDGLAARGDADASLSGRLAHASLPRRQRTGRQAAAQLQDGAGEQRGKWSEKGDVRLVCEASENAEKASENELRG